MNFIPKLCKPYRPQTKGKAERMVCYVRDNFYHPLSTRLAASALRLDIDTGNVEVLRWLNQVANQRIHDTTQCIPSEQLRVEQLALQVLPYHNKALQPLVRESRPPLDFDITPLHHDLHIYEQVMVGL